MASNFTPAGTLINGVLNKTGVGWDEDSQLELALEFISDGGDARLTAWHEFLQGRAKEEDDEA